MALLKCIAEISIFTTVEICLSDMCEICLSDMCAHLFASHLESMSDSILNEIGTRSDLKIWRDLPA